MNRRLFLASIAALPALGAENPALPHTPDPDWPRLPAGWNFQETPGVTVDARDHVYVLHRGPHPILEFSPEGRLIRSWGDGMFVRPHAVRVDPEGAIWVADDNGHQVFKMDESGRVRLVMGRKGESGEGEDLFNRPTDVAFASNGDFYVSDGYGNSRVVQFRADGSFVRAWGTKGKNPGEFDLPHSILVAPDGRVLVGGRENRRVQVFSADGEFLDEWKHVGSPWGLALSPDGSVYLSDGYNDRVLKIDLSGKVLGELGGYGKVPGRLNYAHHVAVDSQENVYVAEIKNWRVQKFTKPL